MPAAKGVIDETGLVSTLDPGLTWFLLLLIIESLVAGSGVGGAGSGGAVCGEREGREAETSGPSTEAVLLPGRGMRHPVT